MKTLGNADAELINDLIMINNDRIERYTSAVAGLSTDGDADLISLLEKLGQQSQQFKSQLAPFANHAETAGSDAQRTQGTWYSAWASQQAPINTDGRASVLLACSKEEELVERVYVDVLNNARGITEKVIAMIKSQLKVQRVTREIVEELRRS